MNESAHESSEEKENHYQQKTSKGTGVTVVLPSPICKALRRGFRQALLVTGRRIIRRQIELFAIGRFRNRGRGGWLREGRFGNLRYIAFAIFLRQHRILFFAVVIDRAATPV